jgi:membrane protease YdiL (CAAX protease family)
MNVCTVWPGEEFVQSKLDGWIAGLLPTYNSAVNTGVKRRAAALLEVLGVYLAGALLNARIVAFVTHHQLISPQNPFALLTVHASNADLLVASRQLALALFFIYFSFFIIIVPLDRWRGRRGPATYGLTRAGISVKALVATGVAAAALSEWPVLIHSLVDAVHPLGAMAPWRQAFFDMSWRRWQFWLFAGILSYAVVPVVEELLFRGFYQRRLAEDWGDGPAILAVACLFTLSHKQYLIANLYNVTMIVSLFCVAIGLGVVFAWTRSLIPGMIAHAIIDIPMTLAWQAALLAVFAIVIFFAWRGGLAAVRQVFGRLEMLATLTLIVLFGVFALGVGSLPAKALSAVGMLIVAIGMDVAIRGRTISGKAASAGS